MKHATPNIYMITDFTDVARKCRWYHKRSIRVFKIAFGCMSWKLCKPCLVKSLKQALNNVSLCSGFVE